MMCFSLSASIISSVKPMRDEICAMLIFPIVLSLWHFCRYLSFQGLRLCAHCWNL